MNEDHKIVIRDESVTEPFTDADHGEHTKRLHDDDTDNRGTYSEADAEATGDTASANPPRKSPSSGAAHHSGQRKRPASASHRSAYDEGVPARRKSSGKKKRRRRKRRKETATIVTVNIVILITIIVIAVVSMVRLGIWNAGIKIDTSDTENSTAFDTESMDSIVALDATNTDVERVNDDDELNILCVGNAPFADDYGEDDNLANIIQLKTGATNVYNAAIADSYMSVTADSYSSDEPMDGYSFYSIAQIIALGDTSRADSAAADLGEVPKDTQAAIDLLTSIDYDKIDVLCIDYDASDYLIQRNPYSDENLTDIKTFSGALYAGIQLIKEYHPDIRIIVMSPTYADYINADGERESSSRIDNVSWSLFVYTTHEMNSCLENSVSYLDNLYGTIYEEIADQYLEDHLHLNVAGRELMADRFIYALNRFQDYELTDSYSTK